MILIIAMVFDAAERSDRIMTRKPPTWDLVKYYIYFSLKWGIILSSFFTFISVMIFTSQMANRTEIVPILSSGVSYKRLMFPYIIGASLIGIMAFFSMSFFLPAASVEGLAFEKKYIWRTEKRTFVDIHIKQNDRSYLYFRSFTNNDYTGKRFSQEIFDGNELKYKLMSETITWIPDSNKWELGNYHWRSIDENGKEFTETGDFIYKDLDLKPDEVYVETHDKIQLNYFQLEDQIAKEEARGSKNALDFKIEFHARFANSFANIILTLLAFFISSKKVRGGIGFNISIGLFIVMLYLLVNRFVLTYANAYEMNAFLAAWLPMLFNIPVLLWFYKKAQK
jgi:lipopolysaccharide export system permease protein